MQMRRVVFILEVCSENCRGTAVQRYILGLTVIQRGLHYHPKGILQPQHDVDSLRKHQVGFPPGRISIVIKRCHQQLGHRLRLAGRPVRRDPHSAELVRFYPV
jgi:hypothetical protein